MNKLFILFGILIVLGITFGILFSSDNSKPSELELPSSYQGAVPEGYDLEYFRKTGITKPLEKKW